MTASEIETKISELKEARYSAVADSLDNPTSEALAVSIGVEIAKLEASHELAVLREKAIAEKQETERRKADADAAEAKRIEADKIASTLGKIGDRADTALNELMTALDEIRDGAKTMIRLDPARQTSLMKLIDPNKVGRAILGRRLADGSMVSDHLGTNRPLGVRQGQSIREFVESFL